MVNVLGDLRVVPMQQIQVRVLVASAPRHGGRVFYCNGVMRHSRANRLRPNSPFPACVCVGPCVLSLIANEFSGNITEIRISRESSVEANLSAVARQPINTPRHALSIEHAIPASVGQ